MPCGSCGSRRYTVRRNPMPERGRARSTRAAAPTPVVAGGTAVRQPLGARYAGTTVNIQYVGGGELTLRSRAIPGVQYNFSRGAVVAVATEDSPRFLNNKDFREYKTAAVSAPPKEEAETPTEEAPVGIPTFPDK